jgi:16S rRNA (guanine966-N2)-methyltransferase
LRIIAGSLKGRRILVPDAVAVRPTPERAREALFSILGETVEEARVLDAYCGSGALGFEAVSRGAGRVVFADESAEVLDAVRANAERMGVRPVCGFVRGKVLDLLARGGLGAPFDLILADPPYGSPEGERLPRSVVESGTLRGGGLLVVERDARSKPTREADGAMARVRVARYGSTRLEFYRPGADGRLG